MGDNTPSMGSMHRSNFRSENKNERDWFSRQEYARKLADLILENKAMI